MKIKSQNKRAISGKAALRYFLDDVFHDSEILIGNVDLEARSVSLSLRNVCAINRVCSFAGQWRKVDVSDFRTSIQFVNVSEFHIGWGRVKNFYYHFCNLKISGHSHVLEVFSPDYQRKPVIKIVFSRCFVEDISTRIIKYIGEKEASLFLFPYTKVTRQIGGRSTLLCRVAPGEQDEHDK
jgi:hypothetical protein